MPRRDIIPATNKIVPTDREPFAQFIDSNWDMVMMKFEGTDNISSFLVTTVCNYEFEVKSASSLQHYATVPKYAPKLLDKMFNMYRTKEQKPFSYIYAK